MTEQAVSMGTNSPNDEDNELTPTTPTAQSGAFLHSEGRDYGKRQIGVAEAALEDGEIERDRPFDLNIYFCVTRICLFYNQLSTY